MLLYILEHCGIYEAFTYYLFDRFIRQISASSFVCIYVIVNFHFAAGETL